jgi:autotransporter-associated beta strand protein/T5SS/PEP-CTERM-associated repeat protein
MQRLRINLLLSLLSASSFAATWTGNGGNTLFNNTANWDGGFVPTTNQPSAFSGLGTLTVTFPGTGYEDSSTTEITTTGSLSLTFNTVGTYWRKSTNTVNWSTPFRVGGSGHGFNIQGTGNTKAQMLMSNALFTAILSTTAITNRLQSGFLNFYDPDGTLSGNSIVLGHYSSRSHYIGLEAGSTSRWNAIEYRGLGPNNMLRVSGGYHEVLGTIKIGAFASSTRTAVVELVSGYLMSGNTVYIGNRPGLTGPGVLHVNGGTFYQTNSSVYVGYTSPGQVNLTGGFLSAKSYEFNVGYGTNGSLTISGGAFESLFAHIGRNNSSVTGTVTMTGGSWTNTGGIYLGSGGVGEMTMTDGTLVSLSGQPVDVGYTTLGNLSVQGGSLTIPNNADLNVGVNAASTGTVTLVGGTVTARSITRGSGYATLIANGGVFIPATNGQDIVANMNVAQLGANGLTIDTAGLNVSMSQAFSDSPGAAGMLVKQGTGTLTLSGVNAYSGTTVVSNGVLKLGVANAITNTGAITVAGGTFDLNGVTVTNGAVSLGDGTISNGKMLARSLDLSGSGVISATLTVSDSLTKSGSGTVELFDNYGYSGSTFINAGTLSLAPMPLVLTNSLAWYDAADASTLTTNANGYVTNWANKGSAGAALDAVQANPGTGPTVLQSGLNGKPVLNIANTSGLNSKGNPGIVGVADRTLFVVGNRTTGGNFFMASLGTFALTDPGGDWFGIRNNGVGGASFSQYGGDINLPNPPQGVYGIYDLTGAGGTNATANVISNGVLSSASRSDWNLTTPDSPICIGYVNNFVNSGNIAEVLVFNWALAPQERAAVEKYLQIKWFGGTPPLPAATKVVLATGATLNLNGASTTVAELSGSGLVSNGTLVVNSSINLTNGATANLLVQSNLTVAAGTTLNYDYTASTSDVVNVTGTLTLQGAGNTVTLNAIGSVNPPPNRITLFTFGTCLGDPSSWSVQGTLQPGYSYRVRKDAGSVYVSVARMGTMIRVF